MKPFSDFLVVISPPNVLMYLIDLQWDTRNSILFRRVKPCFEKKSTFLAILQTSGLNYALYVQYFKTFLVF